jgi:hypothetical protein
MASSIKLRKFKTVIVPKLSVRRVTFRKEAEVPVALRRDALKLMRGLQKPDESVYAFARELVCKIVLRDNSLRSASSDNMLFLLCCALSRKTLPGYSTLDSDQIKDIQRILSVIKRYADDQSQKRPLNILMLASPGAGKSHFIRCIAEHLGTKTIGAITYNMVGLQRHEDLIPALDAVRNLKVSDRLPLLFLDEFDVEPSNYPVLLPLLWDGQLTVGQHDLKLGKVVVVLAGSDPTLPAAMENARSMKRDAGPVADSHPKLIDLLSRINGGVLRIPKLLDDANPDGRKADKVCIAVDLLRQRFGKTLQSVPLALLKFVANADFRYGVRSVAQLIDLLPFRAGIEHISLSGLNLPLREVVDLKASSLAYHLVNDDQAHGIVRIWRESVLTKQSIALSSYTVDDLMRGRYEGAPDEVLLRFPIPRLFVETLEGPFERVSVRPAKARVKLRTHRS